MIQIPKFLIKWYVLAPAAVVVLGGGYLLFGGNGNNKLEPLVVQKMDLTETVEVTGTVKATESVELAFETTGKISKVYADTGAKVKTGQKLVELNAAEAYADRKKAQAQLASEQARLVQYQANVESEKARLDELLRGTRPEEIAVARTAVDNARKAISDANEILENAKAKADTDLQAFYDDVRETLNGAYTDAVDAIRKQINDLFLDATVNPQLSFATNDFQAKNDVETAKKSAEETLNQFRILVDTASSEPVSLEGALNTSTGYLQSMRRFLDLLAITVDASVGIDQTTRNENKAKVTGARETINSAINDIRALDQSIDSQKVTNKNSITTAQNQVNTANNALAIANRELNLKLAGSSREQIDAQRARVKEVEGNLLSQKANIDQAFASIQSIDARIAKTILVSPIDGLITKQDAKVGEIVTIGSALRPVVSIISDGNFQVEVNVTEVRISKVDIGDSASIWLDAYGSLVKFDAKVVSIDPGEEVIDEIPTYKVTLQFSTPDDRIRSGMTANISIVTDTRTGVLAVPESAMIRRNGSAYIRLVASNDDNFLEKEVTVGLKGNNGFVEILSGLEEGQTVLLSK